MAASLIGNSIEYYEFFIYGLSASLVFGKLFFPSFDPMVGTLLSLSTFALAFLTRPIGGWVFGHFGDRLGRKAVLVFTLSAMGGATALIGVLPTYDQIGIAAPILLTVLRFIQGFSLGGETSGGYLMTYEHANQGHKGLFTGIVSTGNVVGLLLANAVNFLVTSLPESQYMSWGWRLPFLFSVALVGVGIFVRSKLAESPDFAVVQARGQISKSPPIELIHRQPRALLGFALTTAPMSIAFYLASVFSFTYGKGHGIRGSDISVAVMITAAVLILGMPLCGWLADYFGAKQVFLSGQVLTVVTPFIWFPLFNSGSLAMLYAGFVIFLLGYAAYGGSMGLFYPSLFRANLRYSGMALGQAAAGLVGGAFAPMIATSLLRSFNSWVPIAVYIAVAALIGSVMTVFMREFEEWKLIKDGSTNSGPHGEDPEEGEVSFALS
ncbi:MFS transporter [Nocardia sp. NPDC059091]|uniref:MFS transporter n=1 Tax=Nocardia sp. NPDC059091 TaxID=3346724 RepID=UPI0036BBD75D